MLKICTSCCLNFVAQDNDETTCIPCVKINSDQELSPIDEAHMHLAQHIQDILSTKESDADVEALNKKISKLEAALTKSQKKVARLEKKLSKAATPLKTQPLNAELLKNIIFLCHPDKHANSEIATSVTQQIIKLRNDGK